MGSLMIVLAPIRDGCLRVGTDRRGKIIRLFNSELKTAEISLGHQTMHWRPWAILESTLFLSNGGAR